MKFRPISSVIALCIALAAGCVSPSLRPGKNAYVYVTGSGNITLDGEQVEMADLPKRLKKMGATQDTPIIFKMQGNVPPRMMQSLVARVQASGFTRAVFESPRHADAFVPEK